MNRSTRLRGALRRHCSSGAILVPWLLFASPAAAQHWANARVTPSIAELLLVDATGEPGWQFGEEEGATFEVPQESVDVRSVYAVTHDMQLWWRAYVSSEEAPEESLRLYLFIDSDRNPTTGGSAAASSIEPEFETDPTNGGYEHVFGISGEGKVIDFWNHRANQDDFESNAGTLQLTGAEKGVDTDPLYLSRDKHGYVSGVLLDLREVNLVDGCDADLFVRAVSDQGNDLNVGTRVRCVPPDEDGDRLPDLIEDVSACDDHADCPARGRCIGGTCHYATACSIDDHCAKNEVCSEGRCVASGGKDCYSSATCGALVCLNGTCTRCDAGGAACLSGTTCGPAGRCEPDPPPPPHCPDGCGIARSSKGGFVGFLMAMFVLGLIRRRNA